MNVLVILLLILTGGALISYLAFKASSVVGEIVIWLVALAAPLFFFTQVSINDTYQLTLAQFQLEWAFSAYSWVFALLVMTLSPLAFIYSTAYMRGKDGLPTFYFSFILSVLGMMGILMSRDFVSLFIFWEIMTWSSYLLVIFLGKDVEKTGIKYMIFSAIGAYSMFMAIVILHRETGSFSISETLAQFGHISGETQLLTGVLLLIGFGLKSAVMPLHVWAPGAYANTPMAFTSVFSGALSKMGIYGLGLVLLTLFNQTSFVYVGTIVAWLGAITAVMATFRAVFQDDAKKLLAYSSVAQLGYIVAALGIGTQMSVFAAIYMAILHGAFKGTLFMAVGAVERQAGTTDMRKVSGLIRNMPWTFFASLVSIIALAGIPLIGGFVGKWMLYEAAISSSNVYLVILIFLSSTAAFLYSFRFLFGLFLGQQEEETANVKEAPWQMLVPMLIMVAFLIVTGTFPGIIFKPIANGMADLGFHDVPWKMSVLTNVWGDKVTLPYIIMTFGLVFIVGLLYLTFRLKGTTRKLSTKEISTSGEVPKPEDNLHYAHDFYKPFERVLEPLLRHKLDKYYTEFGGGMEALFNFIRRIYTGNGQTYALYIVVFLVTLILLSGRIFGL
jgi:NADH-quinone oxidoreductase subunit M